MDWLRFSRRRFVTGIAGSLGTAVGCRVLPAWGQGERVLRVRGSSDLQVLDPANRKTRVDGDLIDVLFVKLIDYQPGEKWSWDLMAAESIEQVDPTHVRFTLKPGFTWTNGYGDVTAEDVKFSFERFLDPAVAASFRSDFVNLKQVDIIDKYSGVIVLTEPFAPLWTTTLPWNSGSIVCKKAVEERGPQITTDPFATSGPYVIERWTPEQIIVLTRNPSWPGARPAYDRIEIYPIDDEQVAALGYEAGDLDFTEISLNYFSEYRDKPPANTSFIQKPTEDYQWLGMNIEAAPFDDIRVRQAVGKALDVDAILDAAYFGLAPRATGIVAPGLIGYRDIPMPGPDLDEARRLLAEAGHEGGFSCTLDCLNQTKYVVVAQVIQAQLSQVGITVEIKASDPGTFWTLGFESEGDDWKRLQLILNEFPSVPDPSWATAWFTPEQVGEWNWERFDSPEFGKLHQAAVAELDPAKRHEMYVRMQQLMDESGAYVYLMYPVFAGMHRNSIIPATLPNGRVKLAQFRPN